VAELPPLGTLSAPLDPPVQPCTVCITLSLGECEQASLMFSG